MCPNARIFIHCKVQSELLIQWLSNEFVIHLTEDVEDCGRSWGSYFHHPFLSGLENGLFCTVGAAKVYHCVVISLGSGKVHFCVHLWWVISLLITQRTITGYDALPFMMGEDQALVAQLPGAKEIQKPVSTLFFCVLQSGSTRGWDRKLLSSIC